MMADPKLVDAIRWARESAAFHAESDAALAGRLKTLADAAEGALSEREERDKLSRALAAKDEAMGELFRRLDAAGVDYSDLVS
jgi:hypothetical protein